MRSAILAASLALLGSGAFAAQSAFHIQRSVYIETVEDGTRVLEPATTLRKGDKVVLVTHWRGADEARRTMLSSSVPETLTYRGSGRAPQAVSADGGENWGQLGELRHDGRLADASDVTDLRWTLASKRGTLTWSAVVR
ncbi:hypothetical protein [Qipengyuania marisflavi]|uniref:Uncharacterized protein n=1 Tax=Qipengyuania marisflavi TaxID=2486356 RepID=A0A5S3PDW2_9SPHN|nr:hypothetical protein [Qipengyuania marisflavi]TMM49740.1 hypothetical protein FEV51_00605 [Qipengyuania marisflavi]